MNEFFFPALVFLCKLLKWLGALIPVPESCEIFVFHNIGHLAKGVIGVSSSTVLVYYVLQAYGSEQRQRTLTLADNF